MNEGEMPPGEMQDLGDGFGNGFVGPGGEVELRFSGIEFLASKIVIEIQAKKTINSWLIS